MATLCTIPVQLVQAFAGYTVTWFVDEHSDEIMHQVLVVKRRLHNFSDSNFDVFDWWFIASVAV